MNRRRFLTSGAALAAASAYSGRGLAADGHGYARQSQFPAHGFPSSILNYPYIEREPIAGYHNASASAYEAFQDMKFGVRIHWGIYSIWHRGAESWPFLSMSMEDRQKYNNLYKTWNPQGFDAERWMSIFEEGGMRMFAFTTKHHEGFSLFDTRTRVKTRINWMTPGWPAMESCDLAYSIMETPFRRDVVKELCDAAHRRKIKIDLYFSHIDWYDADFRPYGNHPLQTIASLEPEARNDFKDLAANWANHLVIVPETTDVEMMRMMARHRQQLMELLTYYGRIDMIGLDIGLGPRTWPEMRKTLLKIREVQPDVMLRVRGIGNYGDYYTPERAIPKAKETSEKPWLCIYPLGTDFSYEPDAAKYKGAAWIVASLIDTVAKGGGLQIGIGPNAYGEFHPEAILQIREAGKWLHVNGEAIYATRPRAGAKWAEGGSVRYTRSKDRRFVYAILTSWPGKQVTLKTVRPRPDSTITLLGSKVPLRWQFDSAKGLTIALPENMQQASNRPCNYAWSLKVEPVEA